MESRELNSWADARANINQILDRLNASPAVALAAAANPILALEELGYTISPAARVEIEERLRFAPREAARLRSLRRQIAEHAGHRFDPDSMQDLSTVLFGELHLAPSMSLAPLPVQVRWAPTHADPLESLRGADPIIEPLLEYRRLEASTPRLASRELYAEIRAGKRSLPLTRLRGRLKSEPATDSGRS